jgi:hypothetical protein
MFLAHPSYTRLEMAEFGTWVVTNKFENNDLSDLAPNIICVEQPTAQAVAETLCWCCEQYQSGRTAVIPNLPSIFGEREDEFPNSDDLINFWHGAS